MKRIYLLWIVLLSFSGAVQAGDIYKLSAEMDYGKAYKRVYNALEKNRFFVIEEIDIGKNLARFKDKWDDYNTNQLEELQVMVICNGWYANQVGNADPDMLALCPMRVTLIHKAGTTTALFARPTTFAKNSKALPVLQEVEESILNAIRFALKP